MNHKCDFIYKYVKLNHLLIPYPYLTFNNNNNNNNNNKEKTYTLIDVPIPADRNVVQKKAEKKLRYNSSVQRTWNLKCTIIPVIIGTTRIVTKSLRKILEAITGKH
jgi:hypothetical protein